MMTCRQWFARMSDLPPGIGAVDLTPVVRAADLPPVGRMETVTSTVSPESARMLPSVPMSPNRVRVESSQDIRDEGPVFEVSPDTSGFLMRPLGAVGQAPVACFPFPQNL